MILRLLLTLIFTLPSFAQYIGSIKQMTYLDMDCRNAAFFEDYYLGSTSTYFFEGHSGNSVNIYQGFYENDFLHGIDTFLNVIPVTMGNDSNINVKVKPLLDNSYLLLFQTNRNGNWDVAYKLNKEGIWSETKYLAATDEDETNPSFMFSRFNFIDTITILHEKEGSIYLSKFKDSLLSTEAIFIRDDSTYYYSAGGMDYISYMMAAACIEKKTGYQNKIVLKVYEDYNWGPKIELISEYNPINPKFLNFEQNVVLSYENDSMDQDYNVYMILDWLNGGLPERVIDDPALMTSKLTTEFMPIITKYDIGKEIYFTHPFSMKAEDNENTFIITNDVLGIYGTKIYIPTRVKKCNPVSGYMLDDQFFIVSTTWEDSADGRIQLFSRRFFIEPSNIRNEIKTGDFYLSQNYPNPFNPNTKIIFEINNADFIKLEVFNLLGESITLLINEYLSPGKYESLFRGDQFASGIYFYKLQAGDKFSIKKMQLLK